MPRAVAAARPGGAVCLQASVRGLFEGTQAVTGVETLFGDCVASVTGPLIGSAYA